MAEQKPHGKQDAYFWMVPESLRLFAEASSVEAVVTLATAFGGRRIRIPKAVSHNGYPTMVARRLGTELAQTLIDVYGVGDFLVPKCSLLMRFRRDRAMQEARLNGIGIGKCAQRFGVHERTVRRRTRIK